MQSGRRRRPTSRSVSPCGTNVRGVDNSGDNGADTGPDLADTGILEVPFHPALRVRNDHDAVIPGDGSKRGGRFRDNRGPGGRAYIEDCRKRVDEFTTTARDLERLEIRRYVGWKYREVAIRTGVVHRRDG